MQFDYSMVKAIVLGSFENITKEETLKKKPVVVNDVIFHYGGGVDDNPNNVS
jgi:hypothetical protein